MEPWGAGQGFRELHGALGDGRILGGGVSKGLHRASRSWIEEPHGGTPRRGRLRGALGAGWVGGCGGLLSCREGLQR